MGSGGGQAAPAAQPAWVRSPYYILDYVALAGTAEHMRVGPPERSHRDVYLLVELQGVPVEQRRGVCAQLLDPAHPIGRIARTIIVRHRDAPNAALMRWGATQRGTSRPMALIWQQRWLSGGAGQGWR